MLVTGDEEGESCGKRVAAADGDGAPVLDDSEAAAFMLRGAGFAATGGGRPLIASNFCTMSVIEVLRVDRRCFVPGRPESCFSNRWFEVPEEVDVSRGVVRAIGLMNMDWGRERSEEEVGAMAGGDVMEVDAGAAGGSIRELFPVITDVCRR